MKTEKYFILVSIFLITCSTIGFAQVTSAGSGNWSDPFTWVGGAVPGTGADVIISDGHKVVLDTSTIVNNLTINGTLEYENITARSLTVNGNIAGDSLKTSSLPGTGPLIHTLTLSGNLSINNLFDLRYGSNPNVGAADIIITGSSNSVLTGPSNMDVNGVTINKSGTAKVILGSNFYQNNNSSSQPIAILNLVHGIIETNEFEWHVKATSSSAGVIGGSPESHIKGTLVRYFPSGTPTKEYPLGDGDNYRPITVYLLSSVSNSGVKGTIVHADANTGSSVFSGDIDKVSPWRYFSFHNISNNNLMFKFLEPSYGTDDGVEPGNTDLRVALSTDERATWVGKGPSDGSHTTTLTNPPVYIRSDSLDPALAVASQGKFYVAIARKTGTTTNPLPVELLSFTAAYANGSVLLEWSTATENGNRGFEIERSIDKKIFVEAGFVNGYGTSAEMRSYSFTDNISGFSGTVYYRLKQTDFSGVYKYSDVVEVAVSEPVSYQLAQNYPNPFNPSTRINYQLPESGKVSLVIYDVLGNLVRTVLSEFQEAGNYSHNVSFDGLSSGTYIYELKVNNFVSRSKMLFLK